MNTFKQFMDDKGYGYRSFDRCEDMDTIINNYGEYCATFAQQPLSGSPDGSPKSCPFCGSINMLEYDGVLSIRCNACGCTGPDFIPNEQAAFEAWDKRA